MAELKGWMIYRFIFVVLIAIVWLISLFIVAMVFKEHQNSADRLVWLVIVWAIDYAIYLILMRWLNFVLYWQDNE